MTDPNILVYYAICVREEHYIHGMSVEDAKKTPGVLLLGPNTPGLDEAVKEHLKEIAEKAKESLPIVLCVKPLESPAATSVIRLPHEMYYTARLPPPLSVTPPSMVPFKKEGPPKLSRSDLNPRKGRR